MARHFDAARVPDEAVTWYLLAGASAQTSAADAEAIRLLDRGLELVGDAPRRRGARHAGVQPARRAGDEPRQHEGVRRAGRRRRLRPEPRAERARRRGHRHRPRDRGDLGLLPRARRPRERGRGDRPPRRDAPDRARGGDPVLRRCAAVLRGSHRRRADVARGIRAGVRRTHAGDAAVAPLAPPERLRRGGHDAPGLRAVARRRASRPRRSSSTRPRRAPGRSPRTRPARSPRRTSRRTRPGSRSSPRASRTGARSTSRPPRSRTATGCCSGWRPAGRATRSAAGTSASPPRPSRTSNRRWSCGGAWAPRRSCRSSSPSGPSSIS